MQRHVSIYESKKKKTIRLLFYLFQDSSKYSYIVHATRILTDVSHWFNYFILLWKENKKRCSWSLGSASHYAMELTRHRSHTERINQKWIMDQWLFTSKWCEFNRLRPFYWITKASQWPFYTRHNMMLLPPLLLLLLETFHLQHETNAAFCRVFSPHRYFARWFLLLQDKITIEQRKKNDNTPSHMESHVKIASQHIWSCAHLLFSD